MNDKRNFYSTNEVFDLFNGLISRAKLSQLIRAGKIPVIKFERKYLVRADWVEGVRDGRINIIN